jgi:cobaltochelatase CobN
MLAIFMVAAEKGFWKADDATIRQMGGELARLVARNGLPGSGHAAPNHPMWNWLKPQIDAADAEALGVTLARAQGANLAPAAPMVTSPLITPASGSKPSAPASVQAGAKADTPAEAPTDTPPPAPDRYYELKPSLAPAATGIPPAALTLAPLIFLCGLAWSGRRFSSTRNNPVKPR